MSDTFGAKATPRGLRDRVRDPPPRRAAGAASTSPACRTRSRSCSRTSCGSRTATSVSADDVETIAAWDAKAEPSKEIPFQPARVLMQDFTGVPAVVDLAAMRDAMDELGGDPAQINPLVPVDLVIDHSVQVDAFGNARAFDDQRRARVRAKPRALRVPALGPEGVRQLPRRPAGDRHLPPGQPRVPRPRSSSADEVRRHHPGLPRHARRHRLPHDDGQRPRRARLGRRRDRGRGGDARPADLDAAAAGASASSSHGELPEGATATDLVLTRHRDAARARRRRQVRRVLRPGPAQPRARRPGDDRQHVAGVRLDLRDLPGRRRDAALPRVHRPPDRDDRAGRRLHARAGHVPRRGRRGPDLLRARSSSTSASSSPRSPARSGPRTGSRSTDAKPAFLETLAEFDAGRGRRRSATAATRRSRSPSRPPTRRPRTTTAPPASRDAVERAHSGEATPATAERRADPVERPSSRTAPSSSSTTAAVVIAAITSCTNTSNPSVMIGAGPARQEGGRARPRRQALGEDLARARLDRGHRLPRATPASTSTSTSSSSTSSATAARPASATPARCPRRSRRRSPRRTSSSARCSRATATSRAGSTRTSAPTTSPRRRCASPTRSPGGWTSTCRTSRSARTPTASRSTSRDIWPTSQEIKDDGRRGRSRRDVHARTTPTSSPATSAGRRARGPRGRPLHLARFDLRPQADASSRAWPPSRSAIEPIDGARVLAVLGDSVTTDHISPAGAIKKDEPGRASG